MPSTNNPKEIALTVNRGLEKLMPVMTPLGVVMGFLFPGVFIHVRPWIPLLFGAMTLSGAIKLRAKELGLAVKSPLPIVFFFIFAHVIMPVLVFLVGNLIFRDTPDVVAGYVLLFSVPTAVSGFIWITIYKGDGALSLALILLDTLLAPLVVPGTVSVLLGTSVALDMSGMAVSLVLMIVAPTIIGVFLNEVSKERISHLVSPYLNPIGKICLVMVVCANVSAVAPQVDLTDPIVYIIAVLCIIFSVIGFLGPLLAGIAGRLSPEKRVSLFFATGLRNISAAATMAIEFFPQSAALPAILGIVFQQTMASLMGKICIKSKRNEED
jgi:tagaturonate reductase